MLTGWRSFGADLATRLRNVLDEEAGLENALAEVLSAREAHARVQQLEALLIALEVERAIYRRPLSHKESLVPSLASIIRRSLGEIRQSIAGEVPGGLYARIVDAEAKAQAAVELVIDMHHLYEPAAQDAQQPMDIDQQGHELPRIPVDKHQPYNTSWSFAQFARTNPPGSEVVGIVERFVPHGAYVLINDARAYASVRFLGDPPPRSPKEALRVGEIRAFVVVSVDASLRTINLALPGVPHDEV